MVLASSENFYFFFERPTNSIPSTLGAPTGQTEYSESNPSPPPISGKPGNQLARRHDGDITGKTRLAQGSNPGFPGSPIIAHQCLTLHQVGVELASPPPLDLEIIGSQKTSISTKRITYTSSNSKLKLK
ncbi:hypothetical protein Hanom_Chr17g01587111 [Helianthus anomalus]